MEKEADLQISERLCTCSLSKGPVLVTEHQNVFFLTQHRISRSDPVVHPSPRSSSVSIGAVANPARPGNSNPADTHPQPLGEGKKEKWHKVVSLLSLGRTRCGFSPRAVKLRLPLVAVLAGRAEGGAVPRGCGRCGHPFSSLCWPAPGQRGGTGTSGLPGQGALTRTGSPGLPQGAAPASRHWPDGAVRASAALKEGRGVWVFRKSEKMIYRKK